MDKLPLILRVKERREGSIAKGQWPSVIVFEVETVSGKVLSGNLGGDIGCERRRRCHRDEAQNYKIAN